MISGEVSGKYRKTLHAEYRRQSPSELIAVVVGDISLVLAGSA